MEAGLYNALYHLPHPSRRRDLLREFAPKIHYTLKTLSTNNH